MHAIRVGAAERTITPPLGSLMAGYFEPHRAHEVEDDLFARALWLESEEDAIAILVCDVLALSCETVSRIRAGVAQRTGIPPTNVLIAATHNHTGPQTVDVFGQPADAAYLADLEANAVEALAEAAENAAPARLSASLFFEPRLNCNRRLVFKDGSVHTHVAEADLSEVVGREGPSDPEACVVAAESPEGNVRALLVNYALHPTNVRGDAVSPDYPGYLAQGLRSALGGEVVTVFANGASGNLDSKTDFLSPIAYGPDRARHIGGILASGALDTLASRQSFNPLPLAAATELVRLPLKEVPAEYLERAARTASEPSERFFTRGTRRPSARKERVYAEEALRMAAWQKRTPLVEAEVQVLRAGELAIVGVPVELFSEFGIEIKKAARRRFRHVVVVELANGYFGYAPTRAAFLGGGYETRLAASSPLKPEAGESIAAAAIALVERI